MGVVMKKHKKDILILIIIFIYVGILVSFSNADNDLIWNYGFSYNFAKGLTMYKDFNMVITPLYPFICGLFMKLLGQNFIAFNFINTIILSALYFYIYKKYSKTFIPSIVLISFILRPSYNFLVLFLLLILLNTKEENDYLIGFILGLITMTKQSFILLTLPSLLYFKKPKKILKRLIGFLIPVLLFILYLVLTNSFYPFLNYTFLGLFSFSKKNSFFNLGTVFVIALIIFLFNYYLKYKDKKVLYLITYQVMAYPIFNAMHILFSIIPVLIYFLNKFIENLEEKHKLNSIYLKYLNFVALILLLCPLFSIGLQYHFKDLTKGLGSLEYKDIDKKYLIKLDTITKEIPNIDKTYFIMYDAYFYKLLLNKDINSYDLLLNGNIGYNGEEAVIKYFNSLDSDTYFLLNNIFEGGQLSKKIDNYIRDNYVKVSTFDDFILYKRG